MLIHNIQVGQRLPHTACPQFTSCTTITRAALTACIRRLREGSMLKTINGTWENYHPRGGKAKSMTRLNWIGSQSMRGQLKRQSHQLYNCLEHLDPFLLNMKSILVCQISPFMDDKSVRGDWNIIREYVANVYNSGNMLLTYFKLAFMCRIIFHFILFFLLHKWIEIFFRKGWSKHLCIG